jgi:hypothetical protein
MAPVSSRQMLLAGVAWLGAATSSNFRLPMTLSLCSLYLCQHLLLQAKRSIFARDTRQQIARII